MCKAWYVPFSLATMRFKWVILLLIGPLWALPSIDIKIGGVFDFNDSEQETAFKNAVNLINNLPQMSTNFQLTAAIHKVATNNSFLTSEAVCSMISEGVEAIFGPPESASSATVESICDDLNIPHFNSKTNSNLQTQSSFSFNMFPSNQILSHAYADLVKSWNWDTYVILYQHVEALEKLQQMLLSSSLHPLKIKLVQLPLEGPFHDIMKVVKKSGDYNIILDCKANQLNTILGHAQQVGLMTEKYNYLITNVNSNIQENDLNDFGYSGTNITWIRTQEPDLSRLSTNFSIRNIKVTPETAWIYDTIFLYANTLKEISNNFDRKNESNPLSCQSNNTFSFGETFSIYLKTIKFQGLSGIISVDENGNRATFDLDIMVLQNHQIEKIGIWSSRIQNNQLIGLEMTQPNWIVHHDTDDKNPMKNKRFRVVVILSTPYVMLRDDIEVSTGNDRFQGFCIELLQKIAEILEFTYEIYVVPDSSYGRINELTGKWNGLIGELQDGVADLAVGDITITSQREKVVDFSTLFMHLGISVVYKRSPKLPHLWNFLSPFPNTIWILIGLSYIIISLTLFMIARISPYEWTSSSDSAELTNDFTLLNAFWYTFGGLTKRQISNFAPKAISTRLLVATCWFVAIFLITMYIAKVWAMQYTLKGLEVPFKDIHDLAHQTKVKYGCLQSGSTFAFFRNSPIQLYSEMWANMINTQPSVFVKNNIEGIERVKKGDYAFLMESSSNEYLVESDCELRQIGGLLDNKGYGIGLQKGSPYRELISRAILKLHQQGTITDLKKSWWKHRNQQVNSCPGPDQVPPLTLLDFRGLFFVLVGFLILAILVAIIEFFWSTRTMSRSQQGSMCKNMVEQVAPSLCFKVSNENAEEIDNEIYSPSSRLSISNEFET